MKDLKNKLTDKDSLIKLQLDRLTIAEQENIKLKEDGNKVKKENRKLKTEQKQVVNKLEEARNRVVDLVEANFKTAIKSSRRALNFKSFLIATR